MANFKALFEALLENWVSKEEAERKIWEFSIQFEDYFQEQQTKQDFINS